MNKLQLIKDNFEHSDSNLPSVSDTEIKWLIAQAEKVEKLEDLLIEADADKTCQAVEIGGFKEKLERMRDIATGKIKHINHHARLLDILETVEEALKDK